MTPITIVPGIDGADGDHWQSRWEADFENATRIAPQSWTEPEAEDWQAAITAATPRPAILVAHSLGCRAAVRWAAANPERALGLFLVAPAGDAAVAERGVDGFDAHGIRVSIPALVVMSTNDPFATEQNVRDFAGEWGAAIAEVGALGHINNASGLGAWPEGRELFEAFAASL